MRASSFARPLSAAVLAVAMAATGGACSSSSSDDLVGRWTFQPVDPDDDSSYTVEFTDDGRMIDSEAEPSDVSTYDRDGDSLRITTVHELNDGTETHTFTGTIYLEDDTLVFWPLIAEDRGDGVVGTWSSEYTWVIDGPVDAGTYTVHSRAALAGNGSVSLSEDFLFGSQREGTYQVSSSGLIEMMVRDADDPDSELEPEFLQLVDDAVLTDIVATRR